MRRYLSYGHEIYSIKNIYDEVWVGRIRRDKHCHHFHTQLYQVSLLIFSGILTYIWIYLPGEQGDFFILLFLMQYD